MSAPFHSIPTLVLGATGYVAGEVLRLLATHPHLQLAGAIARSRAGATVDEVFPHLAGCFPGVKLETWDAVALHLDARHGDEGDATDENRLGPLAVFSALPHGASASLLDELLAAGEASNRHLLLVDLSADYRLGDAAGFEAVYGQAHPAPERCAAFTCALPDLEAETPPAPVAHPGCFTTAVTLACAPLQARGLAYPHYRVSAVTGSTGSGREPKPATHHPERHGGFKAYSPIHHRHEPEMRMLLGRLGSDEPEIVFVPHSGPFSRGIHATIHVSLRRPMEPEELVAELADFYAGSPFVRVQATPPSLKDVVGSNRCHLSATCRGRDAVLFAVIDNLIKGAAGGAVQWMNRLLALDEGAGLRGPALGWG